MSTEQKEITEAQNLTSEARTAIQSVLNQPEKFSESGRITAHGKRFTDDDGNACYVKVVKCKTEGISGVPVLDCLLAYYQKLSELDPNTTGLLIPKTFGVVPSEMIPANKNGSKPPAFYIVSSHLDGVFPKNLLPVVWPPENLPGEKWPKEELPTIRRHVRVGIDALVGKELMHGDIQSKNIGFFINGDGTKRYVLYNFEEGASNYDPARFLNRADYLAFVGTFKMGDII